MTADREDRRLITTTEIVDGVIRKAERRRRGIVIDGLIGVTDDGSIIHIPTSRQIKPLGEVKDSHKFIRWMLDQDPEGWESSRDYKFGEDLSPALKARLQKVRDSYRE